MDLRTEPGDDACRDLVTSSDDLLGLAPDDDPMEFALSASAVEAALFGKQATVTMGRFVILGELGRGGMGVVYSAWDPQLDRRVALKVVRPELSGRRRNARILREAKAAARLSDPHIVAVHEVGESDGRMFIAMEYVEGEPLGDFAASEVGVRRCVELYLQAARGLAAAHEAGIVHRDFKPANVIVSGDGEQARARVTDFGVARVVASPDFPAGQGEEGSTELTADGSLLGTPAYMAPEQFEGRDVGPAADQFSFCVALFEALHGTRPFEGATAAALHDAVVERRFVSARTEAHGSVVGAIRRGLDPDPTKRHADMPALIEALESGLHRGRRWLVGGAFAGALGVAALAGAMGADRDEGPRCAGAADAWLPTEQLGGGVLARVDSQETLRQSMERVIDGYGERWVEARTAVCKATHEHGTQSAELLDLRVACLDQMRLEAAALFEALGLGEPGANALDALSRLDPPEHCIDATKRTAVVPPTDPDRRETFDSLQRGLAVARTDFRLARWKDGHARATTLLEDGRSYGDDQLLALIMSIHATFEARVGEPKAASASAQEALAMAVRAGNDRAASMIATGLVYLEGYLLGNTASAETFGRLALAWSADASENRAAILENLGLNAFVARDYSLAEQRHREAQELLEPGPASIRSALNLSAALTRQDDVEKQQESLALLRSTLTLAQNTYGRDHPLVGALLQNLASNAPLWFSCEEALPMLERVLEIKRRSVGEDGVQLASTLTTKASCLKHLGRFDEALEAVDRAIEIRETKLGERSSKLLSPQERRIEILVGLGRLDEAEEQLALTTKLSDDLYGPDDPESYGLFYHQFSILKARGDAAAAVEPLREAVSRARKVSASSPWTREQELTLAKLHASLGQVEEARALARLVRDETPHPGRLAQQLRKEAAALLDDQG